MKKHRIALVVPAALLAAVALAACGGSSGSQTAKLGKSDVAVVGSEQISQAQFDDLMATAKQSYQTQGRKFPKSGTSEYDSLKSQAVTLLVQQAERDQKAASLGIVVGDKQVEKRLDQIKKQYFKGNEKNYAKALKKQGLSDAQVRHDIRAQLVADALFDKVTKDVKVTDADVHSYYVEHKQSYVQPKSRKVRHILVKSKALAEKIEQRLKAGGDFGKLAKQYSQDPGSKNQGGELTVAKGQTVPPFDKEAFSLKTNEISPPVKTQYGWHVIQALGPVKPETTTPEKQVASQIRQQLLQQKKNEAINAWVTDTQKEFCTDSKIKYQTGFQPSPDPCDTLAAQTTTDAG